MGLRCFQPPHYLPPVKEAWAEGPAEAGKPGEKVRMRVGIPDRRETEGGEGYFHVDQGECRMVWEQRRAGTTPDGSRFQIVQCLEMP